MRNEAVGPICNRTIVLMVDYCHLCLAEMILVKKRLNEEIGHILRISCSGLHVYSVTVHSSSLVAAGASARRDNHLIQKYL